VIAANLMPKAGEANLTSKTCLSVCRKKNLTDLTAVISDGYGIYNLWVKSRYPNYEMVDVCSKWQANLRNIDALLNGMWPGFKTRIIDPEQMEPHLEANRFWPSGGVQFMGGTLW
jgi:hypothetical protein